MNDTSISRLQVSPDCCFPIQFPAPLVGRNFHYLSIRCLKSIESWRVNVESNCILGPTLLTWFRSSHSRHRLTPPHSTLWDVEIFFDCTGLSMVRRSGPGRVFTNRIMVFKWMWRFDHTEYRSSNFLGVQDIEYMALLALAWPAMQYNAWHT